MSSILDGFTDAELTYLKRLSPEQRAEIIRTGRLAIWHKEKKHE